MYAIKIEGLTKYYGKTRGIAALDLAVHRGEFFGFIGPNGAGKSTTIRTLLGLILPTSGRAEILGMDAIAEKRAILEKVGYLPSESAFYGGMHARDVIKLSAALRGLGSADAGAEIAERLQLDTSKKVGELSFGNKKKLSIVCALQHDPELLILDEPTSGLDPLMQKEFFDILREKNEKGTTVFLSSHILSEIGRYCNRAAIIRDGSIIACDKVGALAKTSAKRVSLKGDISLEGLSGVRDLQKQEGGVSFLFGGEIGALLQRLALSRIEDLTLTEPDLEEVFLHYYERGEDADDDRKA